MIFLKVPFAEKDEAKALGARWNAERKSWYVPDGKAGEPFARWFAAGGADFVPAKAAAAPKAKPLSVDSYVGKSVTGKFYQDLPHGCDPFAACPLCAPALLASGWQTAHDEVAKQLGGLRGQG